MGECSDVLSLQRRVCAPDDMYVAMGMFASHLAGGSLMILKMWKLSGEVKEAYPQGADVERDEPQGLSDVRHLCEQRPEVSDKLEMATCFCDRVFWAGLLLIQTKWVGLAVYGGVSVLMDYTAGFVFEFCFCNYVTSVASCMPVICAPAGEAREFVKFRCNVGRCNCIMSVVSFLPTAVFACLFQHHWYGGMLNSKVVFLVTMALITVLFNVLKLKVGEATGWDALVDDRLDNIGSIKVPFAVCLQAVVSLIQARLLVVASVPRARISPQGARAPLLSTTERTDPESARCPPIPPVRAVEE